MSGMDEFSSGTEAIVQPEMNVESARPNFYDLHLNDLEKIFMSEGKEKFRAQQLFRWVYGKGVEDPDKMTNFSKDFRSELPRRLSFELPRVLKSLRSTDGTMKFLFDVGDGRSVETVLIPSSDRLTLCVSSEVGCNMACRFCFTAKLKLQRRLTVSEIVGQYVQVLRALPEGERISNIVFMGMGEPLDNPDNVFKAIDILHSTWGLNISRKKITVSTSGIVPMIPKVTESGVRLAVSLNAVSDEVREKIMPINKRWPLEQLLEACREHCRDSKDKVTLEYVLLKGITDSMDDAKKLAKIARSVPSKINIIPFNEHPGADFQRPSEQQIDSFHKELMRLGVHVLRRKTMGRDIYAACGQLVTAVKNRPEKME